MFFSYLGVPDIVSTFPNVEIQKQLQEMALQVMAKQSYSVLKEKFKSSSKIALSNHWYLYAMFEIQGLSLFYTQN
jgi:hypothetical protein